MIVLRNAGRGGLWLASLCLNTSIAFAQTSALATTEQSPSVLEAGLGALMDAAVREDVNDPRFKGHSEEQRRKSLEFILGNVLFAVTHEVGHMLVSRMNLPVLGREEDAADAF